MNDKDLEQFIHRELRALPPRRAPRSLEHRVLAAIEQRAAVAWYHKSWAYWPAPVRAIFLGVATAASFSVIAICTIFLLGIDGSEVATQVGERLQVFATIYHLASWLFDFGARVVGSIPALWLYGATCFGIGAAAYRTLFRSN
jgi:hypothetical protein